jgi:DNA-binding GntR family transcriptional regulator
MLARAPSADYEGAAIEGNGVDSMDEQGIGDVLTAALLAGRLSPGLRLGEHQLAGLFGVSRERVRKVLHRLGAQRLIDLQPNRGAFVPEASLVEAREVYQARRVIEAGVVAQLSVNVTDRQLEALSAHLRLERRAYEGKHHAEGVRLSGLFHTHLAEMTGSALILRTMQELVSRTAMLVAYHEAGAPECSCAEHRAIYRAIEQRDPAAAGREMQLHLSLVETRLQAPLVRQSTGDLEDVIRAEISRYRTADPWTDDSVRSHTARMPKRGKGR